MNTLSSVPKVTVLTTVYNGEKYLQQTIDSVLNQTLVEIQYIIVDDGSNDVTKNILNDIKDDRVNVITIPHSGRGAALNVGIENCSSEYIAILDADDIADKNRLFLQYKVFYENQYIDVVASQFTINILEINQQNNINNDVKYSIIEHKNFIKHNAICHSSAMIKVECLQKVYGYNANRTELFDYDLWIRLMNYGSIFYRIELPLVYKRIHEDQYFEKRKRLIYLLSAAKCKYRAIRMVSDNILDYVIPIVTFIYGLLPIKLRAARMDKIGRF